MRPLRSARIRGASAAATLRYARTGSDSARYLGWLGQKNLGDEAVHQALAAYLSPHPLVWRPERLTGPLAPGARRRTHDLTILGGGTLIGGRYVDDFVSEPDPTRRVVFGSGVIDPAFPHSYRDGTATLDRWVDALHDIGFLGVRGPRSQELLAERGIVAPVLGDPVARFVRPEGHWQPERNRTIGINVGQSNGAVWGSELTMLAELAELVRKLASSGWSVEYYVVWPRDLAVTEMFAKDTGTGPSPVHEIYDCPTDFVTSARHLDAFVGLKLHSVALALCAGVPSASIEYHPKCRDFMASIGLERLALRSDRLGRGALCGAVEELMGDGEQIGAQARTALTSFRDQQQAAADSILGCR